MKNSKKIEPSKKCTKCLVELPLDHFYSKGKRVDSQCKACKKAASKTSYVAKKNADSLKNLDSFVKLVCDLKIERTKSNIRTLDEILRRAKNVYSN